MFSGLIGTCIGACILFVAAQVYFEHQHHQGKEGVMVGITKTIGSLLFVIVALLTQALETPEGTFLVGGLVLCLAGDVFLISIKRHFFLMGLVSFLFAHIAYCCVFFLMTVNIIALAWAAPVVFVIGFLIWRWLSPNIAPPMKLPVIAYILTICLMVTLSAGVGVAAQHHRWQYFWAAVLFMASDVFVAKDRFIKSTFHNRLIGLPLYYCAQLLFATGHIFAHP